MKYLLKEFLGQGNGRGRGVKIIIVKKHVANGVKILSANTPGKSLNPIVPPPVMGKY